ncbi:putative carnitine operon oxidoreductase [Escherichia coli]|uniref:Putative carnitine operon oxidoreductase n=1 Tax=Escherichia coli TaxID=562 RepID=A0A2X3JA14_ECOLX|nr:putative carnitine operon oxidoreductase [Escherichia coli]
MPDADGEYAMASPQVMIFMRIVLLNVKVRNSGNDSNLLIVFYVQIMPDDFVMQFHRF